MVDKIAKIPPDHHDFMGHTISLDDYVVFTPRGHGNLKLGVVDKINTKMIGIAVIGKKSKARYNIYPHDVLIVNKEEALLKLLMSQ